MKIAIPAGSAAEPARRAPNLNRKFLAIPPQRLFTKSIRWDDLQLRSERSRSQMGNY